MASPFLPETVAEAFVEQYYLILQQSPEYSHKFYQESSLLGWQENDGRVAPATTLSGINEKIMSSNFKNCNVEILTVDAQESLAGGVFVAVSGLWTSNDNVKRKFSQSFFLAKQERGFFVLNDILRFSNLSELTTISAVNDDDKLTEAISSVPNAVLSTVADNNASSTEKEVTKEDIKEAIDSSIPKDVDAKVTVATPSSPPREKVSPVVKPASDAKADAPKITYASVVAKASPPTSPKAAKAPSNDDNRAITSTKTSAPRVEVAPKAPVSSSSKLVSKASTPPSNVGPKSSIANNGAPNANPEARTIYIGGLPHEISKQGVADVMKRFGPLRRSADSVQLKKHDDGFCCGFVEFESADAARRAVEVRRVQFGDKEAYCTYKKYPNRGNDGRGRSPPRSGNRSGHYNGQARGAREN